MEKEIKINSEESARTDLRKIAGYESQNGRWGLKIVSAGFEECNRFRDCIQAKVFDLGTSCGKDVLRIEPTDEKQWVVITTVKGGVKPISGCLLVKSIDLQGGDAVSVLLSKEGGIWKSYGYRRRNSWLNCIKNGEFAEADEGEVLAASVPDSELESKEIKL